MVSVETPDEVLWFQTLAGSTELCSWERHLTLAVPLSALGIDNM